MPPESAEFTKSHAANASETMTTNDKESENVPYIIRPFLSLYRSVPHVIYVRSSSNEKIGLTFALLSCLFFGTCQLLTQALLTLMGWPYGDPYLMAVSCNVPIIHSLLLLTGLFVCLCHHKFDPCALMADSAPWWRDAVNGYMEMTTGYMVYDSINCIFFLWWVPGQGFVPTGEGMSFLGHHVATSIFMLSTRMTGAGHYAAIQLMFQGEFTNPLQNFRSILEQEMLTGCCYDGVVRAIFPYVDFMFGVTYALFRIIVGNVTGLLINYDLLFTKRGRSRVPWGLSILWCLCMWGVLLGSIPWALEAFEISKKYLLQGTTAEL